MAVVYGNVGQYHKALESYHKALVIAQLIGNKSIEGMSLNGIGTIYQYQGKPRRALENFQKALAVAQLIGVIYRNFGKYQKALDYHQQALEIAQRIGNKDSENVSLHNIGYDYEIMGQYQKALDSYKKALAITQQIGDNAGESSILTIIGSLYIDKGKSLQPEKLLFTAIEIYESLRTKLKDDDQKISIFQQQATTYRWCATFPNTEKAGALGQGLLKTMKKYSNLQNWAAFTLSLGHKAHR
jgi:tetratricopeptide (TPR) repeat protein